MDSAQVGLDYIVESPDYIEKLGSALDSKNYVVKKQVFELLSALSVYSCDGYAKVLQTLDYFKKQTGERYRFKFIVSELRNSHNVEYQTAVLAFINCLILATPELQERVRVRSEFIGLRLLNVLGDLRLQNNQNADLIVQIDVFDEQRESDDSHLPPTSSGLDLASPLELFDAIIRQISDTPHETPFLSILQHLLRIDVKEPISDLIWETVERLVHRATLLESSDEAARLLNAPKLLPTKGLASPTKVGAPPPPPPPPLGAGAPPPPPPIPNGIPNAPSPPAPPGMGNHKSSNGMTEPPKLPQQSTPTPKAKMKTVNWSKIPSGQILDGSKDNMWATLAKSHSRSKMDLDWGALEGLFCIQQEKPNIGANSNQTKTDELDRRNSRRDEVTLLDAKRTLNINIYIKQFRSSNDDMIQLIINGSSEDFGAERLRGLLKILPSQDEIALLESVSPEDKNRLGTAEKFLLQLIKVEGYRLRIEAMLLKEELEACVRSIELSIKSVLQAANDVKTSRELQEVIFMILVAGNFLNSGGYAGDAAGVKLSSLQKIAEIRGNKPGIYLLHFIAMQAETRNPRLISFVDDMVALEEASKTSVDQLNTEISALKMKVTSISQQMGNPSVPRDIVSQFRKLFKEADLEIDRLKSLLPKVEEVRIDLAQFFCEDPLTFKLEDCFKILLTFTTRWKSAAVENAQRKKREKEMEIRKKAREEQFKKRTQLQLGWQSQNSTDGNDRNNKVALTPDDEIFIACSPRIVRRRLNPGPISESSNGQSSNDNLVLPSPETTPNGSFRRRRSRAPSEEDEAGLMDYLQESGQPGATVNPGGPTDKKTPTEQYGSLDRSWSRKTRRRPNLLEFVNDERERTISPAPMHQDFRSLGHNPGGAPERTNQESKHESPAREWRERIAAWFVDLDNCGSREIPKGHPPPPRRFQRRLAPDSRSELACRNLATLPEGDVGQEEDNMVLRAYQRVYPDRKPSLKLNTNVLGAMEAIEEVQSPTKETSLWRRPSLIEAEAKKIDSPAKNLGEDSTRRTLIESLGNKSTEDKNLVLYIVPPEKSESSAKPKTPSPEALTGEAKPKTKTTTFENIDGEISAGTREGFNRFDSIRRSRRIKRPDSSTPALPRKFNNTTGNSSPQPKFVSKVDITAEPSSNDQSSNFLNKPRESGKVHVGLNGTSARSPTSTSGKSPFTFSIGDKVNNKSRATTVNSTGVVAEHDEGFEESQSSLSETNSQSDPNGHSLSGFHKDGGRCIGGRSPVRASASMRSPAIRRKSLQENTPIVHLSTNGNANNINGNGNNSNNASSRTSLLSSISSLTSQTTVNTVRDAGGNDNSNSTNPKLKSPLRPAGDQNKRFMSSSFRANGHAPRNLLNNNVNNKYSRNGNDNHITSNSNNTHSRPQPESTSPVEKTKSGSKGLAPRFLSFMRPTASSSAKDKIDAAKSKGGSMRKSFK